MPLLPTAKTAPKPDLADLTVLMYGQTKSGKSEFCSHTESALFLATELVLMSPRPGRIVRRYRPDFSRRFLAGEPVRAIKGDPQFLAMREELAAAILSEENEHG